MEEEVKFHPSFVAPLSPICQENVSRRYLYLGRFNVEVEGKKFGDFISVLRREMKLEPLEEKEENERIWVKTCPPRTFFKIKLQTNTSFVKKIKNFGFLEGSDEEQRYILKTRLREIILIIQMIPPHCLHVVGYIMQNRLHNDGEWVSEFTIYSNGIHYPNLTFLKYFGNYDCLERTCKEKRANIRLGRSALIDAIDTLATSSKLQERARSLLVVNQMLCESIKSGYIEEQLVDKYIVGMLPNKRMLDEQINGQVALQPLNILLNDAGLIPGHKKSKVGPSDCMPREAVEIFAVYINGEDQCNLYGTIKVMKKELSQCIYDRKKDCAEAMEQNDTALLTGPTKSISAEDPFTIYVDLRDRDREDEFIYGELNWNLYDSNVHDKPLTQVFNGKYYSMKLVYGVITHALAATFEVKLGKGKAAKIYGKITVANGSCFTDHESLLFRVRKDSGDQVEISPGQAIPLARSVVAVPVNTRVIFRAELYDVDSNDVIIEEQMALPLIGFCYPQTLASPYQEIMSFDYDEVQVKVTFSLP